MIVLAMASGMTHDSLAQQPLRGKSNAEQSKKPGSTASMDRICVTEWAGYYDNPKADFLKRFELYKSIGVDTIRVQTGWLDRSPMVDALKNTPFRIKMILYVLGIPKSYAERYPEERMVDQHDITDWRLGPWNTRFAETTLQTGRAEMEKLAASGLASHVKELVVDLGPAGEGIYPANWTLNRQGEEAYWCYSAQAQASFRSAMQIKYGNIESANNSWKLTGTDRFTSWADVVIPKPRIAWARGPFWHDMLIWYRDSKRRMILMRIEQTQSLAREYLGKNAKCIIYLPGYAYSKADWDQAVSEASGPASIRLMMDNDWLMATAIAKGCELQYTGVENADEVRNIVRKLRSTGSRAYQTMWGENAGDETAGRNPAWLAEVITCYGLRGIDYTWSNWLFEKDGITPSDTMKKFAYSVSMIRAFYTSGKRISPYPPDETAHQTSPGKWTLDCIASTRLMGSFPDVIKGGDPEIAVVEGGQTQRILLQFPMEALPKNCEIRKAMLVMRRYLNYSEDHNTVSLVVYRVTQPWVAVGATWKEAEPGILWSRPGGTADDSRGHTYVRGKKTFPWAAAEAPPYKAMGDTVEWDITELARKLRDGSDYGLMITSAEQVQCNKSFASSAFPDSSMKPKLYIEVNNP
jgi:hypothetical protein